MVIVVSKTVYLIFADIITPLFFCSPWKDIWILGGDSRLTHPNHREI